MDNRIKFEMESTFCSSWSSPIHCSLYLVRQRRYVSKKEPLFRNFYKSFPESESTLNYSINARSLAVLLMAISSTSWKVLICIFPSECYLSDLERFLARMILNLFRYFQLELLWAKGSFPRLCKTQSVSFTRQNRQWFYREMSDFVSVISLRTKRPCVQNLTRNIPGFIIVRFPLWNRWAIWWVSSSQLVLWLHQPPRSTNSPYQGHLKVIGSFKSCAKARITLCVNLSIVEISKAA
jgi:hypothetical protein